jgi:hypothetical protein
MRDLGPLYRLGAPGISGGGSPTSNIREKPRPLYELKSMSVGTPHFTQQVAIDAVVAGLSEEVRHWDLIFLGTNQRAEVSIANIESHCFKPKRAPSKQANSIREFRPSSAGN